MATSIATSTQTGVTVYMGRFATTSAVTEINATNVQLLGGNAGSGGAQGGSGGYSAASGSGGFGGQNGAGAQGNSGAQGGSVYQKRASAPASGPSDMDVPPDFPDDIPF